MRILVMYENEAEREAADNLAKVLVQIGPTLASNAEISSHGGAVNVQLSRPMKMQMPNVLVRTADYHSTFDQLMAVTLGMERR